MLIVITYQYNTYDWLGNLDAMVTTVHMHKNIIYKEKRLFINQMHVLNALHSESHSSTQPAFLLLRMVFKAYLHTSLLAYNNTSC